MGSDGSYFECEGDTDQRVQARGLKSRMTRLRAGFWAQDLLGGKISTLAPLSLGIELPTKRLFNSRKQT